jgi:hypothetical protein
MEPIEMTDVRRFDPNLLLAFEALFRERSVTNAAGLNDNSADVARRGS